ncbi:MAG: glycine cleavage system aminomethyltransferase GcvT [Deltaproteobacteria bacterium]|nr:glycine cleavage system aminomethyltransferase GcvT [Deltaproteobacteria bacterium]
MSDSTLRRTPMYESHKALGGRLVPFAGWEMPVQYSGIVDEHHAVRKSAGLFDVSHMGEFVVEAERAIHLVGELVTNDVELLTDGQARYTVCCNERGTILDDLIVYRINHEKVLVVCNASNRDKIVPHFTEALKGRAKVTDLSDKTALISVQGPEAMSLLAAAGADGRVQEVPYYYFTDSVLCNVPCTIARTGYTGEDGVEIFCPWTDEALRIWQTLLDLGKDRGVKPIGLGARDTLRLECKMSLYGNDIDETTNPYEAGLGWTVKLDKGDFRGRDALLAIQKAGVSRKLVGFEMTERAIARHGYEVIDAGDNVVGTVTSGSPSPTLSKNIGLAYVPVASSAVGSALRLRDPQRGRVSAAVVVKTPFYKRSK